jgi:tripartite-type tricarboxylate transporter receptor subunit TctC
MKRSSCLTATALALAVGWTSPLAAQSVEEFYSNHDIDLYIGYGAGGGYDAHARTLARHMGKHIPGNPKIIPRNREGAGSMLLSNELAETLPADGTVFALIGRGQVLQPLYGVPEAKFKPREMNWIGSTSNEVSICIVRKDVPVDTWKDLITRGMIVGGTGPGADTDTFPRVLNNVLGTKLQLITGYPGGSDIVLAMERGEVEGRCGYSYSSMVSQRPDLMEEGKVRILMQMSTAPHPAIPDVPLVMDLVESEKDKAVLRMVFSPQGMGRPFVAPAGVPEDRVAALRAAFDATMKDPEYIADVEQQGLDLAPISGEEIQALVEDMYSQPQEIIDAAKDASTSAANLPITEVKIEMRVDEGEITETVKKGRQITYKMDDGSTQTVSISGSRTAVSIDGQGDDRANLTVGMMCKVSMPPNAEGDIEATEVVCTK